MGKSLAIIIVAIIGASVIVASVIVAAIIILFHWEVVPVGVGIVRIDRWTGEVRVCKPGPSNGNEIVC
jgi:hypothetical protein